MQSLIEIIGSTIIGGMLLLLILTSKTSVSQASNSQLINSNIQSNLTALTEIIEADVKNLGYRISDGTSITVASPSKITFKIYRDSTHTDSISYYFTSKLYRKLSYNNVLEQINLGVSSFHVWYYKINGDTTNVTTSGTIQSFKIAITVQDTFRYDGNPIKAHWEKTFKPQNL